jgi:hypothetical protein
MNLDTDIDDDKNNSDNENKVNEQELSLVLDRDTFGIVYEYLNDDLHLLHFLSLYNLKINNKEIDLKNYNWDEISKLKDLDYNFIEYFTNKFDWVELTYSYRYKEEFVSRFSENVIWDLINTINDLDCANYSYDFFDRFTDKLDWNKISYWRNLNEYFVITFADKLNWDVLCSAQGLTKYILDNYSNKIVLSKIERNNYIDETLILDIPIEDEGENTNEEEIQDEDIEMLERELEQQNTDVEEMD